MPNIVCRAVVEVLGKPKEHVKSSLQSYMEKLEGDERYTIKSKDIAEIKKQDEKQELWTMFAELEFECKRVEDIIAFCFDYMPSIIEILEPSELKFTDEETSHFLNDMQAKLFQVDMVAKQLTMQNNHLQTNMAGLMKNFLTVLLGNNKLTLKQLATLTGVPENKIGDYLDKLIDLGEVEQEGEHYNLIKK